VIFRSAQRSVVSEVKGTTHRRRISAFPIPQLVRSSVSMAGGLVLRFITKWVSLASPEAAPLAPILCWIKCSLSCRRNDLLCDVPKDWHA
jgi:hypothetical protein